MEHTQFQHCLNHYYTSKRWLCPENVKLTNTSSGKQKSLGGRQQRSAGSSNMLTRLQTKALDSRS